MRFLLPFVFATFLSGFVRAEERRVVLVDSASNYVADEGFVEQLPEPYVAKLSHLRGGKQDGCSLVTVSNGLVTVTVVPTRGMSIVSVSDARTGERIFGWDAPVKETVNPAFIDLESRGGLGWLEGFNEWMVRCGLEYAGHPGLDQFVTNTGATAEMDLTLHGKIGNIPASHVELVISDETPPSLTLRGVVHEQLFFGPKLELTTELRLDADSSKIDLVDTVTNRGAAAQEYQLIYHANFGTPILEDGSTVEVAARKVQPMNETAIDGLDGYTTYGPPTAGFIEQVYLFEPISDESGRSTALLKNKAGDKGAAIIWQTESLPYLTIWKNTVAEADGYVTGIEPATGYPFNRRVERKYGRVPKLEPGESQEFRVSFVALTNSKMVDRVSAAVRKLQGDVETDLVPTPPSTEFNE